MERERRTICHVDELSVISCHCCSIHKEQSRKTANQEPESDRGRFGKTEGDGGKESRRIGGEENIIWTTKLRMKKSDVHFLNEILLQKVGEKRRKCGRKRTKTSFLNCQICYEI